MNASTNTDLATLSPDWLGLYVAEVLSTDFGCGLRTASGDISLVETDNDREPLSLLVAAPAGLVMGEWDGPDHIEVEFVPWREVRAVGVDGTDLTVTLREGDYFTIDTLTLPGLLDEEDENAVATEARAAAARLVVLMTTNDR